MRKDRMFAKILCANRNGADVLRVAVQVNRGRATIERVVIVDVGRKPAGFDKPRSTPECLEVARDYALYPNIGPHKGVHVLGVAFDGETFTGLGQPDAAYSPGAGI